MNLKYAIISLCGLSVANVANAQLRHLVGEPERPKDQNEGPAPGEGGDNGVPYPNGNDVPGGAGGVFLPSTCKVHVPSKPWKSMQDCCPCVSELNCINILGPKGERCNRGEDCYKTAMDYPKDNNCEAELDVEYDHWFDDLSACAYEEDNDDVYQVVEDADILYNGMESGESVGSEVVGAGCTDDFVTFEEACQCVVWDNCGGGCHRRRRNLNTVEESRPHYRRVVEQEDGISVHVESQHDERLGWLNDHVAEMQQRMESGKTARAWDPLFQAYFENVKDINLECSSSEQDVRCTSTATSQCALDLIKAHASYHEVISASIKENGTHTIKDLHAVPDSCK